MTGCNGTSDGQRRLAGSALQAAQAGVFQCRSNSVVTLVCVIQVLSPDWARTTENGFRVGGGSLRPSRDAQPAAQDTVQHMAACVAWRVHDQELCVAHLDPAAEAEPEAVFRLARRSNRGLPLRDCSHQPRWERQGNAREVRHGLSREKERAEQAWA